MNRLKNGGKDNHRVIISRYCLKHFLVSLVIQLKDRLSIVFYTSLCSLSVVFGAVFMSESGALTLFSCLPWFTVHRFREIFIQ